MIVDAHHHVWDPSRVDYPWMTQALAPIRRAYGPDDLRPHLAARGVDRTILVQTRSSLAESGEFLELAAATDFIGGVVGWVDLADPGVSDTLGALREGPGGDLLVGIRHQVHDERDPDWLRRRDIRRGLREVGEAGLAYDLLIRRRESPAALDTVRALPDVRFVIDHIAKPLIAERQLQPWADLIRPFGAVANVWCKLSGMVTEADWSAWTVDDLRPYVDHVLEVFGPGRLMFGSDWPVCLLAASYERNFDATLEALSALTDSQRDSIFGRAAAEVYRLDD